MNINLPFAVSLTVNHDFPLPSQSQQLARPVEAVQQAANVCTTSLVTSAAPTVATTICSAPTANITGEMKWLQIIPSACERGGQTFISYKCFKSTLCFICAFCICSCSWHFHLPVWWVFGLLLRFTDGPLLWSQQPSMYRKHCEAIGHLFYLNC